MRLITINGDGVHTNRLTIVVILYRHN